MSLVSTLPRRSGGIELRHALPGRLRFRLPRRSIRPVQSWADQIATAPGIYRAELNPRTGGFLIQFDPTVWESEALIAKVQAASRSERADGDDSHHGASTPVGAKDGVWAGVTLWLAGGVAFCRLIGLRSSVGGWIPLASLVATTVQGYPPTGAAKSPLFDGALPAVSTALHTLQMNPVQMAVIYASRLHRYVVQRLLQAMPLGARHSGYPPLPASLDAQVRTQMRRGIEAGLLSLLFTRNPWVGLTTLLAANPRPSRAAGVAIQANALERLRETGIRLHAWPAWERVAACQAVAIDASLFGLGGEAFTASHTPRNSRVLDADGVARLRGAGVQGVFVCGIPGSDDAAFAATQERLGADLVTPHDAHIVYESLSERYPVLAVLRDGETAWLRDPDGNRLDLGTDWVEALTALLQVARDTATQVRLTQTASTATAAGLTLLASTGRIAAPTAALAVDAVALLLAAGAARLGPTQSVRPCATQPAAAGTASTFQVEPVSGGRSGNRHITAQGDLPPLPERVDPGTARMGLSSFEASVRKAQHGSNRVPSGAEPTPVQAVVRQLREPFTWILGSGAAFATAMGYRVDAAAIAAILGLNAVLGGIQEFKADRSIAAMNRRSDRKTTALRDGEWTEVDATDLVPGDLIRLSAGQVVPADAWVVEAVGLVADEALLTGESEGAAKRPAAAEVTPDAVVWTGTEVTRGKGLMQVFATGADTRVGRISHLMQQSHRGASPLQRELGSWLKKALAWACVAGVAIGTVGVLRGFGAGSMAVTGMSLVLSAVPEGLPAILTLAFTAGANRLRPRHVRVRRLAAMDALGCVTVLCLDKTGTLTQNRMTVERICLPSGCAERADFGYASVSSSVGLRQELHWALVAGAACNDVERAADGWSGDPMEIALVEAAEEAGFDRDSWQTRYPRVVERPFDADSGYMAVLCGDASESWVLVKGAPERVVPQCTHIREGEGRRAMTEADRNAIRQMCEEQADNGLRLLALAYRPGQPDEEADGLATELVYAGTVCLSDPLRPQTVETLRRVQEAGLRSVIITGDHRRTAKAVARGLGIGGDDPQVLTGEDLEPFDRLELRKAVQEVSVFARVTAQQKLRIVRALQAEGEVVAVTGDGVNDAPAIRQADVGITLASGTEAACEAADVLLLEDSLTGLVRGIEEAEALRKRIRSATSFLASGNVGEIMFMTAATLLGLPPPLLPSQILLMNVFTDALPALAIATGSEGAALTERRPVRRMGEAQNVLPSPHSAAGARAQERVLVDSAMRRRIVTTGALTALAGTAAFTWALRSNSLDQARTAGFLAAAATQLTQVNVYRSASSGGNAKMGHSMTGAWGMLLLGIGTPAVRRLFQFETPINGGLLGPLVAPLLVGTLSTRPHAGKVSEWYRLS